MMPAFREPRKGRKREGDVMNNDAVGGGAHYRAGRGGGFESRSGPHGRPDNEEHERAGPMISEVATRYSAVVARCNSLGCDRHDIQ